MTGVALLGAGFMAGVHADAWAALAERAQVKVVCALEQDRAAALAARLGADVCASWEEAVAREDVSVVDVCLPTPLHRPVAEGALAAGRHVIVEKPIALSLADADAIAAAAQASGRVAMVGHVVRFASETAALRRVLDAGELGAPLVLSATRLSAPPDWNDWMLDARRSGGVAVDLMIHDFDLANALLGAPRRVTARSGADGRHVVALVEHERGEAVVEGSHALPAGYPFTSGLRVVCEQGAVEHVFRAEPVVPGAGNLGEEAASELRLFAAGAAPQALDVPEEDPWRRQLTALLDAVEHGTPLRDGTLAQARAALAVALAAGRSLRNERAEAVTTHDEEDA